MSELKGRIDFIALINVDHANPNGDPGNDNRPRQTDDGFGEISDVCIKRKMRNRLQDMGEAIFVQSEDRVNDGYLSLHDRLDANIDTKSLKKDKTGLLQLAYEKWIDVRAFGSVFAFKGSDLTAGARGAVTIQPAFSVSEIDVETLSITKSVNSESKEGKASDTMGEKHRVKYGLYVVKGSINARFANKNGLTEEDCEKILKSIKTMFVNDDTSARPAGSMEVVDLFVIKHNSLDGDASLVQIFNSLKITPNVEHPSKYNDYDIIIPEEINGLKILKY